MCLSRAHSQSQSTRNICGEKLHCGSLGDRGPSTKADSQVEVSSTDRPSACLIGSQMELLSVYFFLISLVRLDCSVAFTGVSGGSLASGRKSSVLCRILQIVVRSEAKDSMH